MDSYSDKGKPVQGANTTAHAQKQEYIIRTNTTHNSSTHDSGTINNTKCPFNKAEMGFECMAKSYMVVKIYYKSTQLRFRRKHVASYTQNINVTLH